MADPIRQELAESLHAATLGEAIACDYHQRPKVIELDDPMLFECIRIVDHPQLEEWPDGWQLDAARCDDHAVDAIEEPTKGYEEALVQVPLTTSNDVVSVKTPDPDAVRVLAFEPATDGCHPLVVDQGFMDAVEPDDHGFSRWERVIGMLDAEPPKPLREHIERLIEHSPETPFEGHDREK